MISQSRRKKKVTIGVTMTSEMMLRIAKLLVTMPCTRPASQVTASPSLPPSESRSLATSSAGSRSCSNCIRRPIWSCSALTRRGTLAISWTTWPCTSGTSSNSRMATPSRNHEHGEAAEGAPHAPRFEPRDDRGQRIGDEEADRERHQDALHQPEGEDRRGDRQQPEQRAVDARGHSACSEPATMRAQRTRYDTPDRVVVAATASTRTKVAGPSDAPSPSRARTKATSAICNAVLSLLM